MTNGRVGWTGVSNASFCAQLGPSRSIATGALLSLLAGCGGQLEDPDSREELGRFAQAISKEEDASILGFEDPSQWAPTGGTVGAASIHQSGEGALAVKGGGYREIVSDPLSTLDVFDNTLTVRFSTA